MAALDQHQRSLYMGLGVGMDGKASTAEHHGIIDALRRRSSAKVRKVMLEHITRGEDRIAKALEGAGY
jgi:DNA-binding GntR family transcriptional regulator